MEHKRGKEAPPAMKTCSRRLGAICEEDAKGLDVILGSKWFSRRSSMLRENFATTRHQRLVPFHH
jgi:hypothetical protein